VKPDRIADVLDRFDGRRCDAARQIRHISQIAVLGSSITIAYRMLRRTL
jgi:hypothetical protein